MDWYCPFISLLLQILLISYFFFSFAVPPPPSLISSFSLLDNHLAGPLGLLVIADHSPFLSFPSLFYQHLSASTSLVMNRHPEGFFTEQWFSCFFSRLFSKSRFFFLTSVHAQLFASRLLFESVRLFFFSEFFPLPPLLAPERILCVPSLSPFIDVLS